MADGIVVWCCIVAPAALVYICVQLTRIAVAIERSSRE